MSQNCQPMVQASQAQNVCFEVQGKKQKLSSFQDHPIFHKQGTIPGDFLEDWLYYLSEKTQLELKHPQAFRDFLTPDRIPEVIFWICSSFKQPPEVMYISVELFDRFIVNHLNDLNIQLNERVLEGKSKLEWSEVEQRIQKQVILRILSCVQLASKLSSHSRCITISEVSSMLNFLRYTFSPENILKSELRVFKTLQYRIDIVSPLAYAETLLEILNYNHPHFQPENIYQTTIDLLDVYYMSRNTFYNLVYKIARGEESVLLSPKDANLMRSVKSDYMLLSSGVLVAAGAMYTDQLYNFLLKALSKISSNTTSDLQIVSNAFINIITSG